MHKPPPENQLSSLCSRISKQAINPDLDLSRKSTEEFVDLQSKDPGCQQIKMRIAEGFQERNGCARIIKHNLDTLFIDDNGLIL